MATFKYRIVLRGTNGRLSAMNLTSVDIAGADLGVQMLAAQADLQAIVTALNVVTDAVVASSTISFENSSDGTVPASADVFEKANVVLYTTADGSKTTQFKIPAPAIGIMLGTTGELRDQVDKTDADLIALVAELASDILVSDGENIDTTVTNGIDGGRRITVRI